MAGPVIGFALRPATLAANVSYDMVVQDAGLAGDSKTLSQWYTNVLRLGRPRDPEWLATKTKPVCGISCVPSFTPEICRGRLDLQVGYQILWSDPRGVRDSADEPSITDVIERHIEVIMGNKTLVPLDGPPAARGVVHHLDDVVNFPFEAFEAGGDQGWSFTTLVALYHVEVDAENHTILKP